MFDALVAGFVVATTGAGLFLWIGAGLLLTEAVQRLRADRRRGDVLRRSRSTRFADYLTPRG